MYSRSRLLLSSLMLCAVASTASAFNPQPEPPGFGMIGIVSSQTARLNISFIAPPESERGKFPPGPCAGTIQLRFVDARGVAVAEKTVRIGIGMSEALELSRGLSGSQLGPVETPGAVLRNQIRASVSWVDYPPGPCRAGALFGNVEVYNSTTGATAFVLPGSIYAFQEVDP